MEQGTVKFYMHDKGWGFIEVEGEDDVFFHHSEVDGAVDKGDEVSFDYGERGDRGPIAIGIIKR